MIRVVACVAVQGAAQGGALGGAQEPPARFTLDNGIRVVVSPRAGVDAIVVIAAYDVGSVDDPLGLPQGAHLVEHLRCTAATATHPAGASFARLNAVGSANAETLASMTYYDFLVPPDALEEVLAVEAERLSSLRVTPEDLAREIPRVTAEVDAVVARSTAFLGKFALMAALQGWVHDTSAGPVRTGLEHVRVDDLGPVLARHQPSTLTLVLAGAVDLRSIRPRLDATLGALPAGDPPGRAPIDWDAQPPTRRMTWDVDARVVVVACPPPADPVDPDDPDDPDGPDGPGGRSGRAVLSALGGVAYALCHGIPGVGGLHVSGPTAPVGPLPFHVLAVLDADAEIDAVTEQIHERLDTLIEQAPAYRGQLAAQLARAPEIGDDQLRGIGRRLAAQRGMPEQEAIALVLGNVALQALMREAAGGGPAAARIGQMPAAELAALVERSLARGARRVTVIEPRAGGAD